MRARALVSRIRLARQRSMISPSLSLSLSLSGWLTTEAQVQALERRLELAEVEAPRAVLIDRLEHCVDVGEPATTTTTTTTLRTHARTERCQQLNDAATQRRSQRDRCCCCMCERPAGTFEGGGGGQEEGEEAHLWSKRRRPCFMALAMTRYT